MSRTQAAPTYLCGYCLANMTAPGEKRLAQDPRSPNQLLPYFCASCGACYEKAPKDEKAEMKVRVQRNRAEWGVLK